MERAAAAFAFLKTKFTTVPVLCHPDPAWQFVVEGDASETGIGVVSSQRSAKNGKLYPCPFFSRRFSQDERNCDVGNHELLALVMMLQEWCH